MMNDNAQFVGIVRHGKFRQLIPAPDACGSRKFTTIQAQEARAPESGELDLSKYEGCTITITGLDQGVWVYSAEVVDQAPPALSAALNEYVGTLAVDREPLKLAYQEVCTTYHRIDDFRGKLLGLLPLASGAGILFLVNNAQLDPEKISLVPQYAAPIGLFGMVVTCALFFYELNGIRRCNFLIERGQQIEEDLGVVGQFRSYPKDPMGFIGPVLAARVIYPAVLAAWAFVAAHPLGAAMAGILAVLTFTAAMAWSFRLDLGHPKLGQVGEPPPEKPRKCRWH